MSIVTQGQCSRRSHVLSDTQMRLYRRRSMRNLFQTLLSPTAQRTTTRVPDGQRVYAVGDIHGCADLFGDIISAI